MTRPFLQASWADAFDHDVVATVGCVRRSWVDVDDTGANSWDVVGARRVGSLVGWLDNPDRWPSCVSATDFFGLSGKTWQHKSVAS